MADLFFRYFLLRGPIRKSGSWRSAARVQFRQISGKFTTSSADMPFEGSGWKVVSAACPVMFVEFSGSIYLSYTSAGTPHHAHPTGSATSRNGYADAGTDGQIHI
jgi:hypothetical protein